MNVAIVGCGLIGNKRAAALGGARLVACVDRDLERARALASRTAARAAADWRPIVEAADVDLVIIATPHDSLAEITLAAVRAGKHVLVEKPAARSAAELAPVVAEAARRAVVVHVGFNHRYHRAFRKARELVDQGALGELMFVRARYGHGGRIGYDREWRADPAISGGGELIDQGVHLIDLARWFLGDFTSVDGTAVTAFWDMPVDDNAFLMLRTARGQVAWLHASATEWKNTFSMEIYGRVGKLHIEGLGGSYGTERLTWYRMLPQMGPPETTAWEYPMADDSWAAEFAELVDEIRRGGGAGARRSCDLRDALAALEVVQHIYEASGHAHHP
ncbi:MAG TPA: Gfo/Idh/MocA family oxidoreductase [Kofleriaceae bacterium]|nr:Gfo/Idh/MocA family oxidoreductase [Kofleriaceae bacterium]